jgi:osmotically-inducible protein OsmY
MFEQATLEVEFGNAVSQPNNAVVAGNTEVIANYVQRSLRTSTHQSLRTVQCEHHEGVLVLRGRVSCYYHKQLAQEAVRNVRGVEVILNLVEVVEADDDRLKRKDRR